MGLPPESFHPEADEHELPRLNAEVHEGPPADHDRGNVIRLPFEPFYGESMPPENQRGSEEAEENQIDRYERMQSKPVCGEDLIPGEVPSQSRLVKESESDRGVRSQVERVPMLVPHMAAHRREGSRAEYQEEEPAGSGERHGIPVGQEVLQLDPEGSPLLHRVPRGDQDRVGAERAKHEQAILVMHPNQLVETKGPFQPLDPADQHQLEENSADRQDGCEPAGGEKNFGSALREQASTGRTDVVPEPKSADHDDVRQEQEPSGDLHSLRRHCQKW